MELKPFLHKCMQGHHLSHDEACSAAGAIMSGSATSAQIASLLTALRIKGESVDEISGFAAAMRCRALAVPSCPAGAVDTCGTGGDGKSTFNVSTVAAFVAAGAGCTVAKHGNRAISGKCGSADLFQKLGIEIDLFPHETSACINTAGIGFMYAPAHHRAMKHVMGPRRELGIRTIFNILGPLTNPAGVKNQVVGVYSKSLTRTVAEVLGRLGSAHVLAVHGSDGTDEITISDDTYVAELKNGAVREYTLNPRQFGLQPAALQIIRGGGPSRNHRIALAVLAGDAGPARDTVLLNAGAVIYTAGIAGSIHEGILMAAASIDSGRAMETVTALKSLSRALVQQRETAAA